MNCQGLRKQAVYNKMDGGKKEQVLNHDEEVRHYHWRREDCSCSPAFIQSVHLLGAPLPKYAEGSSGSKPRRRFPTMKKLKKLWWRVMYSVRNSKSPYPRLIKRNHSASYNLKRKHRPLRRFGGRNRKIKSKNSNDILEDLYHAILSLAWWKLFIGATLVRIVIHFFFASLYYAGGSPLHEILYVLLTKPSRSRWHHDRYTWYSWLLRLLFLFCANYGCHWYVQTLHTYSIDVNVVRLWPP